MEKVRQGNGNEKNILKVNFMLEYLLLSILGLTFFSKCDLWSQ
jgi:hypothetical protein